MTQPNSEPTYNPAAAPAPSTPYDRLGGAPGVQKLVDRFYHLMDDLPEAYSARCTHPQGIQGCKESLLYFLSDWFGGPQLVVHSDQRPPLHRSPYAAGVAQREEWLQCMDQALSEQVDDAGFRSTLMRYFSQIADLMVQRQTH